MKYQVIYYGRNGSEIIEHCNSLVEAKKIAKSVKYALYDITDNNRNTIKSLIPFIQNLLYNEEG